MNIFLKVSKFFILEGILFIIKASEANDVSLRHEVHRGVFDFFRPNVPFVPLRNIEAVHQKRDVLRFLYQRIDALPLNNADNYFGVVQTQLNECLVALTTIREQTQVGEDECESMLKNFLIPCINEIDKSLRSVEPFQLDYQPLISRERTGTQASDAKCIEDPIQCYLYYAAMSIAHTIFDHASSYIKLYSETFKTDKDVMLLVCYDEAKFAISCLDQKREDYFRVKESIVLTHILALRSKLITYNAQHFFTLEHIKNGNRPDRYLEYTQSAIDEITEIALSMPVDFAFELK